MRFKHMLASLTFVLFSCHAAHASTCCDKNNITSRTYFSVRPQFQVGSPEHVSTTRVMREEAKGLGMSVQATVFGGQSTNSSRLGRYFMPFDCPKVVVDGEVKEGGTDLMPQHFNIFSVKYDNSEIVGMIPGETSNIETAFKSCISVKPRQTTIGVGLSYLARFTVFDDWNLWFHASAPIVHVENNMRLCESIIEEGEFFNDETRNSSITPIEGQTTNLDTNIRTMTQALRQSGWCFGKIDCRDHNQTELAFIQALIGTQWHRDEDCHAESSFGVTIPTGNKTDACFVFDPVVGNGDHFGIISQTSGGVTLVDWDSFSFSFEMDVVFQYLFGATQRRSLDLKGKPWSRYIEVYANREQAAQAVTLGNAENPGGSFLATPGINVLTQQLRVEPGTNASVNFALLFDQKMKRNGFAGELGYNFYAKAAERIKLKNRGCTQTAVIKDHLGIGINNPARDMTNNLFLNEAGYANFQLRNPSDALADYDTRVITDCQLDLWSATHPCSFSHTVYAMANYQWNTLSTPLLLEFGGSYEFSGRTSAALERWLLWGKLGIQF